MYFAVLDLMAGRNTLGFTGFGLCSDHSHGIVEAGQGDSVSSLKHQENNYNPHIAENNNQLHKYS